MLSREDNEAISRVGPGTLMGNLMRQYWIPGVFTADWVEASAEPRKASVSHPAIDASVAGLG
jgi:hypothetical protein